MSGTQEPSVHYANVHLAITACGRFTESGHFTKEEITRDKSLVTCVHCRKYMDEFEEILVARQKERHA